MLRSLGLLACLHQTPRRLLLGIGRVHDLSDLSHARKETLVNRLSEHLMRWYASSVLEDLTLPEQEALERLAAREGRAPLADFERAFGPLRPYRPWRSDSPRYPWRNPVSVGEALLYRGLIFRIPAARSGEHAELVVLPAELLRLLLPVATAHERSPAGPPAASPAFHPLLDLALFLAYLQAVDVRALHGRWLSACHLHRLGPCLSPAVVTAGIRSERLAERIPFVHYLAESLDLVHVVGRELKPDPTALAWLEEPPEAQMRALWAAMLSATEENRARWVRYRLPGFELRDPPGLLRRVAGLLAAQLPGQDRKIDDLAGADADELIPWWERKTAQGGPSYVQQLLDGPLQWLGVVTSPTPGGHRLTSLGAWLLERAGATPPDGDLRPLKLAEDLVLTTGNRPLLAGVLGLAPWAEMEPGPVLRITPASLAHAVERGGDLQDLLATLFRYAAPPLTPAQRETLQGWFGHVVRATLRHHLILEFEDPGQMDRLWTRPAVRSHLGQRLAPGWASVDTPDPKALVRALRRQEVSVLTPGSWPLASPTSWSQGETYWLVVALLVHDHLARRVGVTLTPPAAILEALAASLEPAVLDAAQAAAAKAIDRLERALDGPGPVPLAGEPDELLAQLAAAIEAGQALCLRYWSAARGEVTERQVQPQRVEWRGDQAYLVAHCHLRGEQRTFRLDRILQIIQCETAPGE